MNLCHPRNPAAAVLLLAAVLWTAVTVARGEDFFSVTGPCGLTFPGDHGPHAGYRTEWWYYTGNVRADTGERFGFQVTFFRRQITPPGEAARWPSPASEWRSDQVYMAHAAVSLLDRGAHRFAQRMARGALDMAGAARTPDGARIHLHDWSVVIAGDRHRVQAFDRGLTIDLSMTAGKPPVPHGDGGYSRKGALPDRASCYYSLTRLHTGGTLTVDGAEYRVEGLGWMDHEYSSTLLEPGTVGWDWFSLQLDDETELMAFALRDRDGRPRPGSSGTFVDARGGSTHLEAADIRIMALDFWTSPHTGAVYPCRWRVAVPGLEIELTVIANLADQEMRTPDTTGVTYWEGSVGAEGTAEGRPIRGSGYVELTGYAGPLEAPL